VDESSLHDLVRDAPKLLPLAREPAIAIVGSEAGLAAARPITGGVTRGLDATDCVPALQAIA
jgi:hypothetical protein